MTLALPTGPRGRLLAVGLALVLAASAWAGVVEPMLGWYAERAQALESRRVLARHMADLAAQLPELMAAAKSRQAAGPPVNTLLDGASDALAGAALQGLVETMAANARARLASAETLPAEQVGQHRRIGLRVSVDASWPVLVRLFQSLAQASPRMFIDDLQLHAPPLAARSRALTLDATFTILALRAGTASDAARAAGQVAGTAEAPATAISR